MDEFECVVPSFRAADFWSYATDSDDEDDDDDEDEDSLQVAGARGQRGGRRAPQPPCACLPIFAFFVG